MKKLKNLMKRWFRGKTRRSHHANQESYTYVSGTTYGAVKKLAEAKDMTVKGTVSQLIREASQSMVMWHHSSEREFYLEKQRALMQSMSKVLLSRCDRETIELYAAIQETTLQNAADELVMAGIFSKSLEAKNRHAAKKLEALLKHKNENRVKGQDYSRHKGDAVHPLENHD